MKDYQADSILFVKNSVYIKNVTNNTDNVMFKPQHLQYLHFPNQIP